MKLIKHFKCYWVWVITKKIRIVIFNVNSSCYYESFPKKDRGFHKIHTEGFPTHGIRFITKKWNMEFIWN